ncbi:hypothetical protein BGX24_001086 [Mortierella sp. AD032]|nr:hypothetical protein BGX24_001086 [Mortierella sp. AD032]
MSYASQTDKALIIHGGASQLNPNATNSQFLALDLTVPLWKTSSPPWKYLTAPTQSQAPVHLGKNTMVLTPDESRVILMDTQFYYYSTYNIDSNIWNDRTKVSPGLAYGYDFTAVMDPDSYVMYLGSGAGYGNNMTIFNVTTGYHWQTPMPWSHLLPGYTTDYSFVYCAARKSILLFGGRRFTLQGDVYNPDLFEFQMAAGRWVRLNTVGPAPTKIFSHCMVPAYNGFKMVLFGGSLRDDLQLGDIYILDVPTMTWTMGSAPPVPLNRSNMACTVGGDNFVAWGGMNFQKAVDGTPVVYNLRSNEWTTTYTLNLEEKSNLGGIIGGLVAAVVVIAGIGYVYYRRRKHRENNRRKKIDSQQQQKSDSIWQQQVCQQDDLQQPLEAYHHHGVLGRGTGSSSSDQSLLYNGSNSSPKTAHQNRFINDGHMSPFMTTFTPLFARDNSARFSLNSDSLTVQQQPPVELYEKGYYVPESSLRNPQFFDASALAARDPFADEDTSFVGSPRGTPQSCRRAPQDYSQQHLLTRSGTVVTTSGGEGGSSTVGTDDTLYEPPAYHEARSNFVDAHIGSGGRGAEVNKEIDSGTESDVDVNGRGGSQDEPAISIAAATPTVSAIATTVDSKLTYQSPLPTAIHPSQHHVLNDPRFYQC